MPRFVARPVVVEAHHLLESVNAMPEAFRLAVRRFLPNGTIEVMTGDGMRICRHTDWVMRGPDGEFSVMKNATFEAMFEPHVQRPTLTLKKTA